MDREPREKLQVGGFVAVEPVPGVEERGGKVVLIGRGWARVGEKFMCIGWRGGSARIRFVDKQGGGRRAQSNAYFPKVVVAIFLDFTFFQGRRSHLKQHNR